MVMTWGRFMIGLISCTTSRGPGHWPVAQACAQFHHKEKAGDVVEVLDDLHDMRMVQSL